MTEPLRTRLLCLRYPMSIWVEEANPPLSSRWRWVIRDRWARDVLHSNGTWKDRFEVVSAVQWMRDQISNVAIAPDPAYPHDEDLRETEPA